jgi:hypothetical protein
LAVACTLAVIACDRGSDDGFGLSMGGVEGIHRDALLVDFSASARDVRGTEARFMATEVGMHYLLPASAFDEQLGGQGRIPKLRRQVSLADVPKPIGWSFRWDVSSLGRPRSGESRWIDGETSFRSSVVLGRAPGAADTEAVYMRLTVDKD